MRLVACGRRSSDFGVKITSGRCLVIRAWRRSRWKYCAGVVRFATRMLPSAALLQEALDAGAGVLRTRALVAVREQQRQPRGLAPLGQAAGDELVDDDLGAVGEVAELRLPEHQRLGRLGRVAVLEAQARDLAQRRVVQLERRERARQRLDRADGLAGLGVVQDEVALGERAALDVLAGQADRRALGQQRGVGQLLGVGPVDAAVGAQRGAAALQLLDELGVDGEALGRGQQLVVERLQALVRDRGRHVGRRRAVELVLAGLLRHAAGGLGRLDLGLQVGVQRAQPIPDLLALGLDLVLGDRARRRSGGRPRSRPRACGP